MEFKSKIQTKSICRKCKTQFLSVDHSTCPECAKKTKLRSAKWQANKAEKEEKAKEEEKSAESSED